ncbi:hypothetical protein L1987_19111 [Smallanthus sonchifolius]|uniref:Uncharacterized protein n=1 Tax=Smallanthus sonchifolius TaxID=185202 RepID=A0ACB9J1K4_9ASTR|nr:hypothetical protein L1987_19111 [Smallanthus sonchifolius]
MPDILNVKAGEISHGDDLTKIKKKECVRAGDVLAMCLAFGSHMLKEFVVAEPGPLRKPQPGMWHIME